MSAFFEHRSRHRYFKNLTASLVLTQFFNWVSNDKWILEHQLCVLWPWTNGRRKNNKHNSGNSISSLSKVSSSVPSSQITVRRHFFPFYTCYRGTLSWSAVPEPPTLRIQKRLYQFPMIQQSASYTDFVVDSMTLNSVFSVIFGVWTKLTISVLIPVVSKQLEEQRFGFGESFCPSWKAVWL